VKALRLVWLFALVASTVTLAQTNNGSPIDQSPLPKSTANPLAQPTPIAQRRIVEGYGNLPLSFEVNQGQTDAQVRFLSRGVGYTLFLTGNEAVFSMRRSKAKVNTSPASRPSQSSAAVPTTNAVLRMKLIKASPAAKMTGTDELPGKSNYFMGSDPKKWRSNVPTYAKVRYAGIYPGIDLIYYGNQRQLEYDFVVAPGADPRRIQFDVRGARKISHDEHGDLVLHFPDGELRWRKPVVYQEKNGSRQTIDGRYVIKRGHCVRFEAASYDPKRALIIDPTLTYSTYLGGSGTEFGNGIAVDSSGDAYVVGSTASTDFPTMGSFQSGYAGGQYDAFIAKLDPAGSALVYSTYLGGSGTDWGSAIALDGSGDAYVTGYTSSTDFPTMNAFQATIAGPTNAFVTKLDPAGSALAYSTYLGGNGANAFLGCVLGDLGTSLAVDSSGSAYVTGYTSSTNFPTMNPSQPTLAGPYNVFVTKFNPAGSALIYSTYLGGSGEATDYGCYVGDSGTGIAIDGTGSAYVTGQTYSVDFPTMNPFQPTIKGVSNGFVTKFSPAGSTLVYSTYLGGSGSGQDVHTGDAASGIAVDGSDNAYVIGITYSDDFPITAGAFQTTCGGEDCFPGDAFVTQFNVAGSALVYSTYLAGSGGSQAGGIALDSSANTYISGTTGSTDFPTMTPFQPANGGGTDAFMTQLNPAGSALVYSTYLGGSGTDYAGEIAVDNSGNAYIVGNTSSTNFPTMNPFQSTNAGGLYDAFVAKLSPSPFVALSPTSLTFGSFNIGTSSAPQNVTLTNSGQTALDISSIATTGDFSQTNTCPVGGSLGVGSNCMISVTFTPSAEGTRTGSVTITDNAPLSPQTVSLSGTGVGPVATLSPSSLNFGDVVVGSHDTVSATLSDTGNATLTITSISITGSNVGDFSQTSTCATSLVTGSSCQITVTFAPTAAGNRTAILSVTDSAPGGMQTATLTGVGEAAAATASPSTVTFPGQYVGTSGLPQTITVTNTGTATLTITSATTSIGDFGTLSDCTNSVPVGANCTIGVFFDPTTSGTRTGTLTITDNAANSPQTVALTGAGEDFSMTSSSSSTATVSPGQTASYTLNVSPSGGFNQTVTFSCSGGPAGSTCSVSPSSIKLNGSTSSTASVKVMTTGSSAGLTQRLERSRGNKLFALSLVFSGALGLAFLVPVAGQRCRRNPRAIYGLVLVCLLCVGLIIPSCGGGSSNSGGGGAGTYNLTVTGNFTSGSTTLTHTTKLTLIVQ